MLKKHHLSKLIKYAKGRIMSETNNLVYFLNSTKDILGFTDENDFKRKVKEDNDFKVKVQKLVYLSKFFGWNNPYIFTMANGDRTLLN